MKLVEIASNFISDVGREMSKVSWPTYDDLKNSTIVVVVLSFIFVVFVFSTDWILTEILKLIF